MGISTKVALVSPLSPPNGRAEKRAPSGRLAPRRAKRARPTWLLCMRPRMHLCPPFRPLYSDDVTRQRDIKRGVGAYGTGTHRAISAGKYRAHMHLSHAIDGAHTGAFDSFHSQFTLHFIRIAFALPSHFTSHSTSHFTSHCPRISLRISLRISFALHSRFYE